jgi:hypothetical protein
VCCFKELEKKFGNMSLCSYFWGGKEEPTADWIMEVIAAKDDF